ncbi:MAG: hypothetical protein ACI9U2_002053, partial [Bradymonadia bacterium]
MVAGATLFAVVAGVAARGALERGFRVGVLVDGAAVDGAVAGAAVAGAAVVGAAVVGAAVAVAGAAVAGAAVAGALEDGPTPASSAHGAQMNTPAPT